MPPVVAAFCRALARICGCHRALTSRSRRAARSGRGFLIWSFTYRSTVRCEMRSIWATGLVPPSCLTRYRICGPAFLGAGRVNAFCTAASRPSPIRLIVAFSYSPLSTSVTVPSLMYRARLSSGGVEPLADFLAPQDVLGALVLDQAGVDAELEAAGQRLAVPVGQVYNT